MKLQIVPARAGFHWVRQGCKTFFRQPLAMSGLFFLFLAVITLAGLVPVLGFAVALALLPGCTLGLMAATREAATGRFPMPTVFLSAFRAGRQQLRAMLLLGLLYGVCFLLAIGVTMLIDDGKFADFYLRGAIPTMAAAQDPGLQTSVMVFMVLQLLVSMAFWHAPALVHWHQVPPVKSVFFSIVACFRNFWAFALFALTWMALFMAVVVVVSLIAGLLGSAELAGQMLLPAMLLVAAMFFTSVYFSFVGCFDTGDAPERNSHGSAPDPGPQ
jgi:hypothetical protein